MGGLFQQYLWKPDEFATALRQQFLLPIVSGYPGRLLCACINHVLNIEVDLMKTPFHCLDCTHYCEQFNQRRHDRIRDCLIVYLRRFAGVAGTVTKEPALPAPNGHRKADILFCKDGRNQYIDVALCNPCAPTYLEARQPGEENPAMDMRKRAKERDYEGLLPADQFVPFILSATGSMHESARQWVEDSAQVGKKKTTRDFYRTFCFHEISFHCAQQNARARMEAARRARSA
jgi:hypothetical protein